MRTCARQSFIRNQSHSAMLASAGAPLSAENKRKKKKEGIKKKKKA
jgi:hypothetical protein